MDKFYYLLPLLSLCGFLIFACQSPGDVDMSEQGLQKFISEYNHTVEPLMTKYNQSQWDAYITGKQDFFDAATDASLKIDSIHQNQAQFEYLKKLRAANVIEDALLKRQLDILYREYLNKQIDPKLNMRITEINSQIESIFANFRTTLDGQKFSDNEVTSILQTEMNMKRREDIWRAQKAIGDEVAPYLKELTNLRNQAAQELSYDNYYFMAMDSHELNPKEVESIFAQLYELTEEPYQKMHDEIDSFFAKKYHISKSEIRPWHYEDLFAQEAPAIFEINLDSYYKNADIPAIASRYYHSAQLPVDDILSRSDLYEKAGKSQHAFSFDINRKQDIRILCNIVPNARWMETTLHELGHGLYDKYLDPTLSFLLREPAHFFTTEGIAQMFGSYASNAVWMRQALQISEKDQTRIENVTRANLRLSKIIFARWSMVLLNFEKNLYDNPDQDLNALWWDLVEKYQLIKPPDKPVGSEWAAKLHLSVYPVYYQNYILGELFASQVRNYINQKYYADADIEQVTFWNKPEAGDYLKQNIFKPGKSLPWNEMIKLATAETLNPAYFVNQYVKVR
jgi:peptidyl-dipeptidase A